MSAAERPVSQQRTGSFPHSLSLPLLIALALVVMGVAGFWTLAQTNDVTKRGYRLRDLEQERNQWQAQVHRLELETASLASLERVQQEARQRLAMGPPKEIIYLPIPSDAIAPPSIPYRFLPTTPVERPPHHSGWQTLLGLLPLP